MNTLIRLLCILGVVLSLGALWLWGSPINLISLVVALGIWGSAEVQLYMLRVNEQEIANSSANSNQTL